MADLADNSLRLLHRRNGTHNPANARPRGPLTTSVRIIQATKAQRQISHPDTTNRSLTTIVRGLARRTDPPVGVGKPLQQSPVTTYVQITGNGLSSTSGSSTASSTSSSSSSSSSSSQTSAPSSGGSGISGGAAAGIAIGCVAAVALLAIAAFLLWRRRKQAAAGPLPGKEQEHKSGAPGGSSGYINSENQYPAAHDGPWLPGFPVPAGSAQGWQPQPPPPSELPSSVIAAPTELPATMDVKPVELPVGAANTVERPGSKDEKL